MPEHTAEASSAPSGRPAAAAPGPVVALMREIRDSRWFQHGIIVVIVLAGVLVGAETYREFAASHHGLFRILDQIIIWIFVAEALVKMAAEWPRFWRYFGDPWNVFDFLIVAACFLPIDAQYVMVLRLARLLRVVKLVRALPRLQLLVGALLRSIPSMGYVSLLLLLLFYIYAVAATFMFSANDPVHFASLPLSIQSLFRAVTLEDWTDLMYINQYGCDHYDYPDGRCVAPEAFPIGSPLLFVTIVLLGTMIVLNLFIGVIMNGMNAAQEENDRNERARRIAARGEEEPAVHEDLDSLAREMDRLQGRLKRIQARAERQAGAAVDRSR
jgi:voltage-gated sodium channel